MPILEIDSRENGGFLVRLTFDTESQKCFVDVIDEQEGLSYTLTTDKEHAKDYFDHPSVYFKEGVVSTSGFEKTGQS